MAAAAGGGREGGTRAAWSLGLARRVAELLAPLRHPAEVVEVLLHDGAAHLGANTASLCLLDQEAGCFELVGSVGYGEPITSAWHRFPVDAPVPARDAVLNGRSVLLGNVRERDERYPIFAGTATSDAAYAVVPVGDDPAVGALTLGWPEERTFDDADELALLELLGALAGQALERARLFEAKTEASERLAVLTEVSRRLGESLDVEATLVSVLDAMVPAVADTAVVHLLGDGELRAVAVRHRDPAAEAAMQAIVDEDGGRATSGPMLRAARHGEVSLTSDLPPGAPLDLRSSVVLPLWSGDGTVGTLSLTMTGASGRRFVDADLGFLTDVAGRAGVAIAHAIAHRARIEIAETLQQSLLPPSLPALPGLEVASVYRPMAGGRVGGDFFDVFPLGAGVDRFGLLIGDVSGKGVAAAALTARIRYTVRALAPRTESPAELVSLCNAAVHDGSQPERFATMVYAIVDASVSPVVVDLVVAGHPEPAVWDADGLRLLAPTGPVVGLFPDGEWRSELVELPAGRVLVLFTDGLTEARTSSGAFVPALLGDALTSTSPSGAQEAVSCLVAALDAVDSGVDSARDDLAILALSAVPSSA